MRILINAYAVRPNSGSEGGAAWQWIIGLSRQHELFVITEGEWQNEISNALASEPYGERIHFFFNPVSELVRRICWNQGDYRFYYYYAKWQKKTLEIAHRILAEQPIDLIHQLNMIGFREPGYLWQIEDIPYIWGPIGGMNMVPLQYLEESSRLVRLKYRLKNNISQWQYKHYSRVLRAIDRANILVAANKASYKVLTKLHPDKDVRLLNETGCASEGGIKKIERADKEFNILWVGRFIPTKLLGMSLQVIKRLEKLGGLKFHIVGQAFDRKETLFYHRMADNLGLSDICRWHGWVSHDEVQHIMQSSDVFFFPSVVEGTPHVVLESIANELPVVCFDTCGQAEVVNDEVGRKIPLSTPKESIELFAGIINELYMDRQLLKKLSEGCRKRREELSWANKIIEMDKIYRQVAPPPSNKL